MAYFGWVLVPCSCLEGIHFSLSHALNCHCHVAVEVAIDITSIDEHADVFPFAGFYLIIGGVNLKAAEDIDLVLSAHSCIRFPLQYVVEGNLCLVVRFDFVSDLAIAEEGVSVVHNGGASAGPRLVNVRGRIVSSVTRGVPISSDKDEAKGGDCKAHFTYLERIYYNPNLSNWRSKLSWGFGVLGFWGFGKVH